YMTALKSGKGQNGEGFNIVRLPDPFSYRPTAGANGAQILPGGAIRLTGDVMLMAPSDVKTSWNDFNDGDLRAQGRTGYSVKFVSFQTLLTGNGVSTDGQGTHWTNALPLSGYEQDLKGGLLQH